MIGENINSIEDRIPVFSVIIPVYNTEKFLYKCIDSLLDQSYTDFELILVDDGATDRSGKICDEYAEKDLRIKVFHTCNQGVSMARNLGLSVARGKYVHFVDSDDWVTSDYLEKYLDARKDSDYDVVYMEMLRISENGYSEVISLKNFSGESNEAVSEALTYLLDCGEFGFTCNKSFKRDIIISNLLSFCKDLRKYEDAIFTSMYCLHIHSIRLIPSAVYYYRSVATSLIRSELDYETYHLTTRKGCRALEMLAKKWQSDSLYQAVGVFCQKWEQWAILLMYLSREKISKKDRLNYLKEFQYRFILPLPNVTQVEGIYKFAILGMYFKNDKIVDLYFCLIGFLNRLRRNLFK